MIPVGEPVNDAERMVLRHLRDHAPDDWTVVSNFELSYGRGRQVFEVDLAILTDHVCLLADTKGAHGRIEVRGARWYLSRGSYFPSPVRKSREHAKVLGRLLRRSRSGAALSVWCDPLVILPFDDSVLRDPAGLDEPHTVRLRDLVPFLAQYRPAAGHPVPDIAGRHDDIVRVLLAEARTPAGPRTFGRYEVEETLAETDPSAPADPYDPYENVSVYRVRRQGQAGAGTYLLQVHGVDPLLPEAELDAAFARISTPMQALGRLKASEHIVACVDDFPVDDQAGYAVVLEDVRADALRVRLTDQSSPLGADARRRVMSGVLAGLAHAHAKGVVHRGLTPDAVLVDRDGDAMLTGFDLAYPGQPRGPLLTVRQTALTRHDAVYLAPEVAGDADAFSPASDMYAAGALFHELYTGEPPDPEGDTAAALGEVPGLDSGVGSLVAALLDPDPRRRPQARDALELLERHRPAPGGRRGGLPQPEDDGSFDWHNPRNYADLRTGFRLTEKFRVRAKLGRGQFGVVYRVYNVLDDEDEVLKILTGGGLEVEERLKKEYRALRRLPPHPNLVRLIDAEWLPKGGFPYLRMEFAEGRDLQAVIDRGAERPLGPADVLRLLEDCLKGLGHLHGHGVYHCDIKPSNLLWTPDGTRLLDFNAAVSTGSTLTPTLGSPKFIAPGALGRERPRAEDLTDLDLYATGLSAYMALTGCYPWRGRESPPRDEEAPDPRDLAGFADLGAGFTGVLRRAISPRRSERFPDAEAFRTALREAGDVRRTPPGRPTGDGTPAAPRGTATAPTQPAEPGRNPFVAHLQTLYSQNARTNAGTRGLDPTGFPLYVETALDTRLAPAVLRGEHRLVVITGNAGDGKTAFLQHLAATAAKKNADFAPHRANGDEFTYRGRLFRTNHDGSQDEDGTDNDTVLEAFLAPYRGESADGWTDHETRLLAINEGRLADFLSRHEKHYPLLADILREGLASGQETHGVAVVNLNARDVFADPHSTGSIMRRMVETMTDPRHWEACGSCPLASRCYALHNARTFAHPTAGPQVRERLTTLHRMARLRGRLHITLRDLRSALAHTLTSGRDCDQIHALYAGGADTAQQRLDSFYFTSWAGIHTGGDQEHDRFLTQLRDLDMAQVPDPQLDRRLDYTGPSGGHSLISVDQRGNHDEELLREQFTTLPRTPDPDGRQRDAHRAYLAAARRRFYFESLDDTRWTTMVSHRSGSRFLGLLDGTLPAGGELARLVEAISRGEEMPHPIGPDGEPDLALQVRAVRGATIRSHRLFPAGRFTLDVRSPTASPYVETSPRELVMSNRPDGDGPQHARLVVRLDLYELLDRLHRGHRPGVEDRQGQNLALTVFKNALSAASCQEVLLSAPGSPPYRLTRQPGGTLRLAPAPETEH
ncbi:methylation-associated defense system protein kinase MAD6 [Streptomyces sp. KMM 9044]|uniref:methylation-associated defense system protein kinase MAD6 n=1 Tax=Streptomyces sp. KMM 9044 TaxID=2744474 RepID=UPI00215198BE|nr:protein kinase [Streptomyces sp. KMM 9044]WAX81860.1 protein kinase [Streptomyces sp. KMM 9044]